MAEKLLLMAKIYIYGVIIIQCAVQLEFRAGRGELAGKEEGPINIVIPGWYWHIFMPLLVRYPFPGTKWKPASLYWPAFGRCRHRHLPKTGHYMMFNIGGVEGCMGGCIYQTKVFVLKVVEQKFRVHVHLTYQPILSFVPSGFMSLHNLSILSDYPKQCNKILKVS